MKENLKKYLKKIPGTTLLRRLHEDRRGAEGLEKLLIIAAITLPLLGLLIWLRNDIQDWVTGLWDDQKTEAENWDTTGN